MTTSSLSLATLLLACWSLCPGSALASGVKGIPPSWAVMPIPRYVNYGRPGDFVELGKVAVVRRVGSPYESVRDNAGELAGESTITEEELTAILKQAGVVSVKSVPDDLASCDAYDSMILLGSPVHNAQTARYFDSMELSFDRWDDVRTPDDDFAQWKDFGREGYLLKVGRVVGKNVIILAGYDFDDAKEEFYGAGTFYALQSLRQLIVVEDGLAKVKVAEIADKPLIAFRGVMSGWRGNEQEQFRDIAQMAATKTNNNVYWYGNRGYNPESASKWRHPWRPDQLAYFSRAGKWCREHFITMNFCMNPDHYNVEWAAAKTFDGSSKNPVHYNPAHGVEPAFKQMWAKLSYEVQNDVDILAAKYGQLREAAPGARLQLWNEDDIFGLAHPEDKELFRTETGDAKQDAINYGRARAQFQARVYRRIRELYPDSPVHMPVCPPAGLHYQFSLEQNVKNCREFLTSLGLTLEELGVLDSMPSMTSGGGCSPEALTAGMIRDFKNWFAGGPVLLHDDNFMMGRAGAYETDPMGPHSTPQIGDELPAGYRDKELYKYLWGITHNGSADGMHKLSWCESQYMWNMLALDREKVNDLAVRRMTSDKSYPAVRALFEEFERPVVYTPDTAPPARLLVISDRIAFPADRKGGWQYSFKYVGQKRVACQRLRERLAELTPQVNALWEDTHEKKAVLKKLVHRAASFCAVYLANGYIQGWESDTSEGTLTGVDLRDLFLEADDLQERFFAGPLEIVGRASVLPHYYFGAQQYLYTDGILKQPADSIAEAAFHVDIWKDGLEALFFEPLSTIELGEAADDDPRLVEGWGKVEGAAEGAAGEGFREVSGRAILNIETAAAGQLLVRARLGTDTTNLEKGTSVKFSTSAATHEDLVCKPRWINWLLPKGSSVKQLGIHSDNPVRVYAIAIFKQNHSFSVP